MAHGSIYVVVRVSRELEDERGAPAPSSIVIVHPPGRLALWHDVKRVRETSNDHQSKPQVILTQ
jgi:hypothetical protein